MALNELLFSTKEQETLKACFDDFGDWICGGSGPPGSSDWRVIDVTASPYDASPSNTAAQNTVSFNQAINVFNASPDVGVLLIPRGTYAINTTTAISAPGWVQGENGTTLNIGAGQTGITVSAVEPVHVRNIRFQSGGRGVHFTGLSAGTGAMVEDNIFDSQSIAAIHFDGSTGNQWTIRSNIIQNTTDAGIRIDIPTDSCECVIDGNEFALNTGTAAIDWLGGGDLRILNNKFNSATTSVGESIVRLHNIGVPTTEIMIVDNVFSNAAQGLLIDNVLPTGRINVTGNMFGSAFGDLVRFDSSVTTDLFLVANQFTGAASPLVNLLQGARVMVESNAFLGNATNLTGVFIDTPMLFTSVGINKYSLPLPSTPIDNNSATTEFLPGRGTADDITVWSGDFLITSYTGFQWQHATRIFNMDSTLVVTNPSGFDVSTAVLASGNTTLDETGGSQQFAGALGAFNSTLHTSRVVAVVASESSLIENDSREVAIVGATLGHIDHASRGAIVGGTSGFIGSSAINVVLIGGTGGSIAPSLADAISLNGASVATSSTTGIGGTRLDVPYLASSGDCIQTDVNGTFSVGPCGGGGGTVGPGTTNALAKFTAATVVGDSRIADSGTSISIGPLIFVPDSGSFSPGFVLDLAGFASSTVDNSSVVLGFLNNADNSSMALGFSNTVNNSSQVLGTGNDLSAANSSQVVGDSNTLTGSSNLFLARNAADAGFTDVTIVGGAITADRGSAVFVTGSSEFLVLQSLMSDGNPLVTDSTGLALVSPSVVYVTPYGTTRAAIQAAVDAAPDGGIVQLDCVDYTLDATTITIDKGLDFRGCAPAGGLVGTRLINGGANPTVDITSNPGAVRVAGITFLGGLRQVVLQGNNQRSIIEDNVFALPDSTSAQTTALVETIDGGGNFVNQWVLRHNTFAGPATVDPGANGTFNVWIHQSTDTCECEITGNNFLSLASTQTSLLEWSGAGDVRIISNKFLGTLGGSESLLRFNNTGDPTSEIVIADNVISKGGVGIFFYEDGGSVVLNDVVIANNQINTSNTAAIFLDSTLIDYVTISGNNINIGNANGISVVGLDVVGIHGNVLQGATGTGINVDATVTNSSVGANTVSGFGTLFSNGSSSTVLLSGPLSTLANLGTPTNGSFASCTNCNPTTSPCTAGGSGAFAIYISSNWVCV